MFKRLFQNVLILISRLRVLGMEDLMFYRPDEVITYVSVLRLPAMIRLFSVAIASWAFRTSKENTQNICAQEVGGECNDVCGLGRGRTLRLLVLSCKKKAGVQAVLIWLLTRLKQKGKRQQKTNIPMMRECGILFPQVGDLVPTSRKKTSYLSMGRRRWIPNHAVYAMSSP